MAKPFLEIRIRADTTEQKKEFAAAADNHTPPLSLNQWFLMAAAEKLARDAKAKKKGRG